MKKRMFCEKADTWRPSISSILDLTEREKKRCLVIKTVSISSLQNAWTSKSMLHRFFYRSLQEIHAYQSMHDNFVIWFLNTSETDNTSTQEDPVLENYWDSSTALAHLRRSSCGCPKRPALNWLRNPSPPFLSAATNWWDAIQDHERQKGWLIGKLIWLQKARIHRNHKESISGLCWSWWVNEHWMIILPKWRATRWGLISNQISICWIGLSKSELDGCDECLHWVFILHWQMLILQVFHDQLHCCSWNHDTTWNTHVKSVHSAVQLPFIWSHWCTMMCKKCCTHQFPAASWQVVSQQKPPFALENNGLPSLVIPDFRVSQQIPLTEWVYPMNCILLEWENGKTVKKTGFCHKVSHPECIFQRNFLVQIRLSSWKKSLVVRNNFAALLKPWVDL